MKRFIYVVIIVCFSSPLFSQTLPALGQLTLWLRADSGVVLVPGSDSIQQWQDLSGNGYNTTGPATLDSMPVLIAHDSILNNMPAISFNPSLATNRQEFYGVNIPSLSTNSLTMFIVCAGYNTNALYTNGMFTIGTEAAGMWVYRRNTDGSFLFLNNGAADGYNYATAGPGSMPGTGFNYSIWGVEKYYQSNVNVYVNSALVDSVSDAIMSGTFTNTAPYLIGNTHNISGFTNLNGKIAEIIVYTTALNSTDRQTVLNYLYNKYAPPVNLGPDTVATGLCAIILNAGNRFVKYHWSTGDSVHSQIAVTRSGSYAVTVTDVFGRKSSDTIHVTVPFQGTTPVDTTICFGQSAVLKQIITNPPLYTFTWNTGATVDSITVTAPGKYTCNIYDNVCHIYDTITVKVDSLSLLSLLPASAHICGGTCPALNDAGYNIASYLWSPGGSTLAAPPINTPGTYNVTAIDINGCSATGSSNITIGGHAPVDSFSIAGVCYTYPTNFANLSTPVNNDNIASISWTFPGASPSTSSSQNPVVTYPAPAVSYATLTVTTDSGCTATKTDTFLIHKNPLAQFTGSVGCTNNSYQFINQSSSPVGDNFSSWLWSFGDGTTDTSKNPLHQYSSNGPFTVTLTATDSAGCSNSITQSISLSLIIPLTTPVTVLPGNNAVFQSGNVFFAWNTVPGATGYSIEIDSDPLFGNPTIYPNITGTSYTIDSLPGGTTYYWEVIANNLCGGAMYSQEDTFSIFSPAMGQCLTLWLRADSVVLNGTNITTWKDISGNGYNTTGPVQADSLPGWVAHEPLLNNMPSISFNPSTGTNYQEFYGTKIPTLTNNGGVSYTTFIVASGLNVSAIATPSGPEYTEGLFSSGALLSGMVMDRRVDNSAYDFVNNYTADGAQTILTAGTNSMAVTGFPYTLWGMQKIYNTSASLYTNSTLDTTISTDPVLDGTFTPGPYMIANVANGATSSTFGNLHGRIAEVLLYSCALTSTQMQQVQNYIYTRYAPPVYLGADTALHNLCPFTINAGNRFVSYQWSTGDNTDYEITVNHAGAYSVTVTDVFGHTSSSTINVSFPFLGTSPVDTTICLGQSVILRQLLVNPASYTYSWNTGGTADSITVDTAGKFICNVFDGTCHLLDTIIVKIDSFSLLSLLKPDTLICGGSSPALYLQGYTPVSYLWSPGGSTSPTPAFDSAGVYHVTVTDTHGCTATGFDSLTFHAHAPIANFSISNFCYGAETFFINLDTMFAADSINSIFWNIPGANPASSTALNPIVTYASVGPEFVTLSITTDSGCTASKTDSLFINKAPQASFTYTGNNSNLSVAYILCAGNNNYATFTDHTIPGFSTDSLISRMWSVNGVVDSSTLSDSVILYQVPQQGIYNVMLVVENEKGCVDTLVQQVQVFAPLDADFSYSNVCLSDTTHFLDQTHSYSIVTWQWNFGDGSQNNYSQNPSHQYQYPGSFAVSLEVTNAIGCESFISQNVTVVDTPSAYFTGSFACQKELYAPLDSSIAGTGDSVVQWQWLIADSNYNMRHPQVTIPAGLSSFESKLVITTQAGCTDSIIKTLPVYPTPVAQFIYTPLYGTAPITINFTNSSTGAATYNWNFGDGAPVNTDLDPSHIYVLDSTYQVVLEAINSYGCIDSVAATLILAPTQLDIAVDNVYSTVIPQSNGTVLVQVVVLATNQASRLITSAQFKVTLGCGGGTYVQNWTGTIPQGGGLLDTIPVDFDVNPAAADCYICVTAQDVNGGQTELRYDNNEICASLTGTMQLAGPSPNPAISQSTLGIIMPQAGTVTVEIIDELGQPVIKNATLNLPAGLTNYVIPVAQLNGSEYYIRVIYNGDVEIRKLITR